MSCLKSLKATISRLREKVRQDTNTCEERQVLELWIMSSMWEEMPQLPQAHFAKLCKSGQVSTITIERDTKERTNNDMQQYTVGIFNPSNCEVVSNNECFSSLHFNGIVVTFKVDT